MGVYPVRYCVVVNSVTLKILVSFIVSPVRCLLSNGVKEKANHPPLDVKEFQSLCDSPSKRRDKGVCKCAITHPQPLFLEGSLKVVAEGSLI